MLVTAAKTRPIRRPCVPPSASPIYRNTALSAARSTAVLIELAMDSLYRGALSFNVFRGLPGQKCASQQHPAGLIVLTLTCPRWFLRATSVCWNDGYNSPMVVLPVLLVVSLVQPPTPQPFPKPGTTQPSRPASPPTTPETSSPAQK